MVDRIEACLLLSGTTLFTSGPTIVAYKAWPKPMLNTGITARYYRFGGSTAKLASFGVASQFSRKNKT